MDPSTPLSIYDISIHILTSTPCPKSKVGHATICAPDEDTLAGRVGHVARSLDREEQANPVLQVLAQPV